MNAGKPAPPVPLALKDLKVSKDRKAKPGLLGQLDHRGRCRAKPARQGQLGRRVPRESRVRPDLKERLDRLELMATMASPARIPGAAPCSQ